MYTERSAHYQRPSKPKKKLTANQSDREGLLMNDEGLYAMWQRSRMSKTAFIKANKQMLDAAYLRTVNADPPSR